MNSDIPNPTKRSAPNLGETLAKLRDARLIQAEEVDVDRWGICLTVRLRATPDDLDPAHMAMFFRLMVDKLQTAYQQIDQLKGRGDETL